MAENPPTAPQPAPVCAAEFDQARSFDVAGFVYFGAVTCALERGHEGLHQCGMASWNNAWCRRG